MELKQIMENLHQPIPSVLIASKSIKGNKIDFVPWYDICDLLDERCGYGAWEWRIENVAVVKEQLSLVGSLTIHGDDRTMTMMATGIEDINCSSYGDPSSNAEAMALRRAASKCGLGRDMWRKTPKKKRAASGPPPRRPSPSAGPAPAPKAITPKEAAAKVAKAFNGAVVNGKADWYDKGVNYFVERGLESEVVIKLADEAKSKQQFFEECSSLLK